VEVESADASDVGGVAEQADSQCRVEDDDRPDGTTQERDRGGAGIQKA
jgi:hypothetical protein